MKNTILTIRLMLRNKLFSALNIVGLSFGLACTILLYLWINNEVGYDSYHKKIDRSHLVQHWNHYGNDKNASPVTPSAMSPAFKEKYPEVELTARYFTSYNKHISYEDKSIVKHLRRADPDLLDIFTCKFIYGSKEGYRNGVKNIIISESISKQFFGDIDPVGKVLMLENEFAYTVQGVFEDFPDNVTFSFELMVPFEDNKDFGQYWDGWGTEWCYTFALLKEDVDYTEFDEKIVHFLEDSKNNPEGYKSEVFLRPLNRIYLYNVDGGGPIEMVRLFGMIAIFIILIACFNYTNLATARAEGRAKEIALRKVLSSSKGRLIRQFLGESFIFTFLALNFSLIIVRLMLPLFNSMSGKDLSLNYLDPSILISLLIIWIFTSFVAGLYPAFILSSFKITDTLKGSKAQGVKGGFLRKVLVIIQFSLSIGLIISSLVVNEQLSFLKNIELGLEKENLIYMTIKGEVTDKYDIIKNELLSNDNIESITRTSHDSPYRLGRSGSGLKWDGKGPDVDPSVFYMDTDEDFINTFKIKLLSGRFFSPEFVSDINVVESNIHNVVINKTLAEIIGTDAITEKTLSWGNMQLPIIGVVDDFLFLSAHQEMQPLIIFYNEPIRYIYIRISGNEISSTVSYIQSVFEEHNPAYEFDYGFLDESYETLYRNEEREGKIMRSFTLFAILISCLGLFGLAAFSAQKRTKEIGIRKALGAPVKSIVLMLAKEMTRWILISNIIAWPIAYYFMSNWLNNYPYHYELNIWIFILAGVAAFILSLLTVIFQAIIASTKNPVDSLRYE
jgi:ABC-type antimicrobial peptide transport system permease subunit